MNLFKLSTGTFLVTALPLCLPVAVRAQPDAPSSIQQQRETSASTASPLTSPLRAARLTFLAGAVRIQRSDNTGEDSAVLNMPLGEGTRILTGDYGQAEVEFEDGSVARVTPRSALSINMLALDSAKIAHTELALLGGLAYFELRKSPGYTWLIDAGGTRLTPLENLTARVNLDEPPASFAVLTGAAHLERPDAFEADVRTGETLRPDHDDNTRYFLTPQLTQESWDSWNESRDRAAADAAGKRTAARDDYAADQGYGWSDLDASGNWYNVPGTGQVWQPDNADEGFDPYGYGAWVWGNGAYVWASAYTWGWTPFRCGYWQNFSGFGWGWIPNSSCGSWAFAGGGYLGGDFGRSGVFVRGPYPPRHNPVIRPLPRPGAPHPVIPVRGPDGPRPWTPHVGPTRIAGTTAVPLPSVGSGPVRINGAAANALALDFPLDRKTHQPILGTVPTPSASQPIYGNAAPSTPRLTPGTRRPHLEDTPVPAPSAGTGGRRNPAPAQGTGSAITSTTQRQGSGTPPTAAPRPAPTTAPGQAPSAPSRPTPAAPPPPSRPSPPPPAPAAPSPPTARPPKDLASGCLMIPATQPR